MNAEFHLVQNRKENCHHDHIPFNLKGIGNMVFSVTLVASRSGYSGNLQGLRGLTSLGIGGPNSMQALLKLMRPLPIDGLRGPRCWGAQPLRILWRKQKKIQCTNKQLLDGSQLSKQTRFCSSSNQRNMIPLTIYFLFRNQKKFLLVLKWNENCWCENIPLDWALEVFQSCRRKRCQSFVP